MWRSLNYYHILQQQGKTPAQAMEIIQQRSRDNGRTPMQWDASAHAGFTTGTPWIGVVDNYRTINAAAEVGDPDSIYSYYKQLVALRKQRPVIQSGRIEFLYKDDPDLLAYRRWDETGELLVLCNLTGPRHPRGPAPGLAERRRPAGQLPRRRPRRQPAPLRGPGAGTPRLSHRRFCPGSISFKKTPAGPVRRLWRAFSFARRGLFLPLPPRQRGQTLLH